MVGYYFEQRRGIAAGLACSGAGFGLLTMAPLAAFLVAEYTWRGALIVLAGVSLNCLVCGALMRPLLLPTRSAAITVIVSEAGVLTPQTMVEFTVHVSIRKQINTVVNILSKNK